jgi:hypothetical protein
MWGIVAPGLSSTVGDYAHQRVTGDPLCKGYSLRFQAALLALDS